MIRNLILFISITTSLMSIGCGDAGGGTGAGTGAGTGTGTGGAGGEAGDVLAPYPGHCSFDRDDDGDGWWEFREAFDYDEDWNVTFEGRDADGDGDFERLHRWIYDGGVLALYSYDGDGDAFPEIFSEYFYDSEGRLIRRENQSAAGSVTGVSTYSYSADELTRYRESDADNDGSIDTADSREVDEAGRLVRLEVDDDADGTPERVIENRYDPDGQHLSNHDDKPGVLNDEIWGYEYDEQGRQVLRTLEDGERTLKHRRVRIYDDEIRRVTTLVDRDGDGVIDDETVDSLDEDGRVVRTEMDFDMDGRTDRSERSSYSADGLERRTELDYDADSSTDTVEITVYNERGNKLSLERDHGVDGRADYVEVYSYDCFID